MPSIYVWCHVSVKRLLQTTFYYDHSLCCLNHFLKAKGNHAPFFPLERNNVQATGWASFEALVRKMAAGHKQHSCRHWVERLVDNLICGWGVLRGFRGTCMLNKHPQCLMFIMCFYKRPPTSTSLLWFTRWKFKVLLLTSIEWRSSLAMVTNTAEASYLMELVRQQLAFSLGQRFRSFSILQDTLLSS